MKRILLFLSALFIATTAIAHTINWYVDGSVYHTTTCESGEDVTPPTAPEKSGYTFKGWDVKYTVIEYLESTGTQWIDTGFISNQDTGVKTKTVFDSVINNETMVFGSATVFNENAFEFYLWDSEPSFNYNNRNLQQGVKISVGDTIVVDWNKNIIKYSKNDEPYIQIMGNCGEFTTPYPMYIFANKRPTSITGGKVKIYYFQIYDNDTLVRNFIPVLDSDGVPCMFDLVEHKFYYNAGTGDFIAGPIVGE